MSGKHKEGVVVEVRVQPKASRAQVEGVREGVLRVRLTAPPADGAANEQLLEVLSKHFKVPKSSMEIIRGLSSRNKLVLFRGVEKLEL